MINKILLGAMLLSLLSIVVACSGSVTAPAAPAAAASSAAASAAAPQAISKPSSALASNSPTPAVDQPVTPSTPKPRR